MIPFRFSTICFHVVLLLAAVGMLSSCGRSESSRSLGEIESYMDSHSDSRLDDLLAIDSAALQSPGDRMLYEVLLTQALDKAHESIASRDSVMQVAADWFSARSDPRHALLANYFLGRIKFEKKEYPESLVAMFKAHDLAKELDDKYWTGMSARGISDVYYESYNGAEAVEYSMIEYDNLKSAGLQPYINYALYDLAKSYSMHGDFRSSLNIAKQFLDSAYCYKDPFLEFLANRTIGTAYVALDSIVESSPYLIDAYESEFATREDSAFLSTVYVSLGNYEEGQNVLDKISSKDDIKAYRMRYVIYKEMGLFEDALNCLVKVDSVTDAILRERISSNLTSSVVEYYDALKQKKETELEKARWFAYMWIFITIIVLSCIIYAIVRYRNLYQAKINTNIILAQNFKDILSIKTDECNKANIIIKELIDNKVEMFDKLCRVIYENNDSLVAKKKISIAVNEFIEQFSINSEKITELEELVNRSYDNIMLDLRHDLPNMKNADYALFLYTILGFSISTISIFLKEEKISAVYDRKRRLKDKIKKLDSPNREKYMDFLG